MFKIVLFILALIPRIYQLDQTEIYNDEITWMVKGKETFFALKQMNFQYFDQAWWKIDNDTQAISFPLVILNGTSQAMLGRGGSRYSLELFPDFVAARLPIAFFNSLLIPILYVFAKKFISQKVALLSAILLAFDPAHLGSSRFVVNDGLLTLFTFSTIAFFAMADKGRLLMLSSISLTAGALTKPTGLLPIIVWLSTTQLKKVLAAVLLFLILMTVFWPGSWQKPIISFLDYLWLQASLVGSQPIKQFFLGEVTTNPSPLYYLFQISTRLPLAISVVFFLSPIFFLFSLRRRTLKPLFWGILVFNLIYFLILALSPHKLGVRYILPLWPWLYLTASWALVKSTTLFPKSVSAVLLSLVIFSQILNTVTYFPNTHLFYNSLIGGAKNAQKYDLIGVCAGAKGAMEFLDRCYDLKQPVAYIGCGQVIIPYYSPRKVSDGWSKAGLVVVENSFTQLLPQSKETVYFNNLSPVYTVSYKGIILSRVYQTDNKVVNKCFK